MTAQLVRDSTKFIKDSLSFLDNLYIRWFLIILVILYITGFAPMMTAEVSELFHTPVVKFLFLLFILYIAVKDFPLALLLVVALLVSMQMGYTYQAGVKVGKGGAVVEAGVVEADKEQPTGVEAMVGSAEAGPDGGNYNQYFDCVKDCADGDIDKGALDTPCTGVGVWKDELNAQGLDCPLGFSGEKVGSPF